MPKLRQNIVTGEWVVISPERSKRPEDFVMTSEVKQMAVLDDCPFCIENHKAYEASIKEAETENVYVIPNLYPAFVADESIICEGDGFYYDQKAVGGHEVIILKNHIQDIYEDGQAIIRELIGVYLDRYKHYSRNPIIEYTMIIHNHGPEAGASIDHPHSQLFASSVTPSYVVKELEGSKKYFTQEQKCVFCEMLKVEQENAHRIIYENDDFLVFTFFASRFPFEIWIVPKRHESRFELIEPEEQVTLADAMQQAMNKLNRTLNFPPFNYWIHTLPHNEDKAEDYYHWHMEIVPRVSKFGGYELGSGTIIDVVSPESAAQFLLKA